MHIIQLKHTSNPDLFAATAIKCDTRPNSDLELHTAVIANGGAWVSEYEGASFKLREPKWIDSKSFTADWIGD